MNMHPIDWAIVATLLFILTAGAFATKQYTRSVAAFLAASRCGGRYLLSVADNMAAVGVISLVWFFEISFDVGFTAKWWGLMQEPLMIVMALSGWVIYRFRQTRAMTLAQYLEMRYSRRFRIFAGLVAFFAGVLNFGIFPSIGAHFFIMLCGFPDSFTILGVALPTFPLLMAFLLSISLLFTFLGGQIAIMVTDFLQGAFCNIVFAIVIIFLLITFSWGQISEALLQAPPGHSMVNPFDIGKEANFDFWYYIIDIVILFYCVLGWQGTAGYNCASKSAHETKMAGILKGWRTRVILLIVVVLPICVRTFLTHPDFFGQAAGVHAQLASLGGEELQSQARIPLALATLLPMGLMGLMCAAILAAFISTHDTYLHSWGSMFIQDVVLPFRKKPLTPKQHLWLLRSAIFGVAVYIFFFSLFFRHTQRVAMYCAITASVFVGGAGTVIIGGLYWKRGTTAAAWAAMITGLSLSLVGILITQGGKTHYASMMEMPFWKGIGDFFGYVGLEGTFWAVTRWLFYRTGQEISFWVIIISVTLYFSISLFRPKKAFNMDRLLHRGKYAVEGDSSVSYKDSETIFQKLGFTREFTTSDKIVAAITLAWPLLWFLVFLAGNIYHGAYGISNEGWLELWRVWLWILVASFILLTAWLTIGGAWDMKYLFRRLRALKDNPEDDGRVDGD